MLCAILCLLPIVLAGTLDEFVGLYDVSKVVDWNGLNFPALARAIVPHLFQSELSRPTTDGLEFEVELEGPIVWRCVCSQLKNPMVSKDYCGTYHTTEVVTCTNQEVEASFGNYATYIDQRDFEQRRKGLVPAKYHLESGAIVKAA